MSSPTNEQWTAMSKLVQSFYQRADAEPFRAPVEWKSLGLYDYPQVIKKPMDLGTVKRKITDRKYKTLRDAADDVRLVWTNCKTYNADGSDFYVLAENLSKKFEDRYAKLLADQKIDDSGSGQSTSAAGESTYSGAPSSSSSSSTKVSLDDKRAFARSLYKMTKEDLGKLLVEVDSKCPAALTKNAAEDECEFNIDKLTPAVFHEMKALVSSYSSSGSKTSTGSSSKKKSSSNKRQKT